MKIASSWKSFLGVALRIDAARALPERPSGGSGSATLQNSMLLVFLSNASFSLMDSVEGFESSSPISGRLHT